MTPEVMMEALHHLMRRVNGIARDADQVAVDIALLMERLDEALSHPHEPPDHPPVDEDPEGEEPETPEEPDGHGGDGGSPDDSGDDPPPPVDPHPGSSDPQGEVGGPLIEIPEKRSQDALVYSTTSERWLTRVYGADNHSTAARNRVPLVQPGQHIFLEAGRYRSDRITRTIDLLPGKVWDSDKLKPPGKWGPLDVVSVDRAKQNPRAHDPITWIVGAGSGEDGSVWEGGSSGGHTLYIEFGGAVYFARMRFLGDGTGMIIGTETIKKAQGEWMQFRDIGFFDCWMDGGWDAMSDSGPKTKWGVFTAGVGRTAHTDGRAGWIERNCEIHGVEKEHAHYFHNVHGNTPNSLAVELTHVGASGCGRTFFQLTARPGEDPDGHGSQGNVLIQDCSVVDACLENGGGGYAFALKGGHDGTISILRTTVLLGADSSLHPNLLKNIAGCFQAEEQDSLKTPTRECIIRDCHFQVGPVSFGEGSAKRPLMEVDHNAFGRLEITGTTLSRADTSRPVLDLAEQCAQELVLDVNNQVTGKCRFGGTEYDTYVLMCIAIEGKPGVEIVP